jgi:flagellar biosynthesis protein FlhF
MATQRMKSDSRSSRRGSCMMPRAFRARNMPAALAAVEKALGSRALIVSVHPVPAGPAWQVWRHPGVEVVAIPSAVDSLYADAGTPERNSPADSTVPPKPPAPASAPAPAAASESVPPAGRNAPQEPNPPEAASVSGSFKAVGALQTRLLLQGVDPDWVAEMARSISAEANPRILNDTGLTGELVRQEIRRNVRTDGGTCLMRCKVIILIGSSGCGKTSACAKIASHAQKSLGKRVHWISSDTTRAGAIAKAQAFTAPLGIPLHLTYRPDELPAFLHWDSNSELALVDTAGCNPFRVNELAELGRLLEAVPDRHILWVAPATAKEEDLLETHAAFSHLGLGGVVVTRMDETRTFGGLINSLRKIQLPVAFFSNGPRIQGDLQTGDSPLLTDLLLGGLTR